MEPGKNLSLRNLRKKRKRLQSVAEASNFLGMQPRKQRRRKKEKRRKQRSKQPERKKKGKLKKTLNAGADIGHGKDILMKRISSTGRTQHLAFPM